MNERAFLRRCLSEPIEPDDLHARLMARIQRWMLRRLWIKTSLTLTATVGIVGYIFVSRAAIRLELEGSSFLQLVRLAISDPDIIFSNTREAGWSLMESIPFQSVVFTLVVALFCTSLLKHVLHLREARQEQRLHFT